MWMTSPMPMVTITKTFDVSNLLKASRKSGMKFNVLLCWCIGKAATQVKEFYHLPEIGTSARDGLILRFRFPSSFITYIWTADMVPCFWNFCRERIPLVRPVRPQASFLIWIDCRGLGLNHEDLISLFIDKAGLALNDGEMFNPGGEGFMRLNIGTPRKVIEEALIKLEKAIKG